MQRREKWFISQVARFTNGYSSEQKPYDVFHWLHFIVRVAEWTNDVFFTGENLSFAFRLFNIAQSLTF